MKKIQILISFTLMASLAWGQAGAKKTNTKAATTKESNVTIKCTLENCSSVDSLSLYQVEGTEKKVISIAHANSDGSFTFTLAKPASPRFYMVGLNTDPTNVKPILVSDSESNVLLTGPCYNLASTSTQNSAFNDAYNNAMKRVGQLKVATNKAATQYQANYNSPELRAQAEKLLTDIDAQKLAFLDSLKKTNPFVAKIVALDTYTSFQGSAKKDKFKDEVEYFATQYFQYVNWADTDYNAIPQVTDLFKSYTQVITIPQLNLSRAQQKAYLEALLKPLPPKSAAYKLAINGVAIALMEAQNPILLDIATQYNNEFPNETSEFKTQLSIVSNNMRAQMIDVPAPEITQADTTGKMRKLSDLKGKYVLLDFWASWCGPCRRENPNVVRLYNKYKTRGFEIFSVSLDQTREKWIKAIQDDGLIWENHVSDLRYWSNEAARTYSVQSIPTTVLLDKTGTIIARNLRGESLEAKLKELMGE